MASCTLNGIRYPKSAVRTFEIMAESKGNIHLVLEQAPWYQSWSSSGVCLYSFTFLAQP